MISDLPKPSEHPVINQWLSREGWAEMLASAQPAELGLARLRALIPGVVLICFAGYLLFGGELNENKLHALWFTIGFFVFAVVLALHILAAHDVSKLRRYLGMVADNAGNTYFMLVAGEQGAPSSSSSTCLSRSAIGCVTGGPPFLGFLAAPEAGLQRILATPICPWVYPRGTSPTDARNNKPRRSGADVDAESVKQRLTSPLTESPP